MQKPNYPITYVEDWEPREVRHIINRLRTPRKAPIPRSWIYFVISLAIILAVIIGAHYGIR